MRGLDTREFQVLSFAVQGLYEGEDILVGLKDRSGHEQKISIGPYLSKEAVGGWRQIQIPLTRFTSITDWNGMENLSFSFENGMNDRGTVLLDDIEFQKDITLLMVDNFEDMEEGNLLGRTSEVLVSGLAKINGVHAKNSPNGIYQISYGGEIGSSVSGAKSFAEWTTGLGGIDCSQCEALTFRIKGEDGKENPAVYLNDGNFRWAVEVAHSTEVTTSWQTVTIPLSVFSDNGVDITHLKSIQVVFEGVPQEGTVYLDNIQFESLNR